MKVTLSVNKWTTNCLKYKVISLLLFITILFSGCNINENTDTQEIDENQVYIYYIDKNETKLVTEVYEPKGTTNEELIEEYLTALSTNPKNLSLKKAKPDNVLVEKYSLSDDDDLLSIYFSSEYSSLIGISEVLCRASIVKTLTQIKDVDVVEFYVGGQILLGANDKPIRMINDDFLVSSGAEDVYVTVYFANEEGTALVDSDLKITYDGNVSIEKLILDRLIDGPIEENMLKAMPDGTKLIKVSTKDSICYVDLNDKFLDKVPGITDEVVIYSIVNSLVELSTITKVQFTINGDTKKMYRDSIPFDVLFERNLDLMVESK
jgi:germination protein M